MIEEIDIPYAVKSLLENEVQLVHVMNDILVRLLVIENYLKLYPIEKGNLQ